MKINKRYLMRNWRIPLSVFPVVELYVDQQNRTTKEARNHQPKFANAISLG